MNLTKDLTLANGFQGSEVSSPPDMSPADIELLQYLAQGAAREEPGYDALMASVHPELSHGSTLELSYAQQRFWLLEQSYPGDPFHNVAVCLDISGSLDGDILEQCLQTVVDRHEVLRTSFAVQDGQPVQVVHPWVRAELGRIAVSDTGDGKTDVDALLSQLAREPVSLAEAPIIRATLCRLSAQHYKLVCVMHHIASDALSLGVLWKELDTLYSARLSDREARLPELSMQYADYARAERAPAQAQTRMEQLARWERWLAAVPPGATLPPDFYPAAGRPRTALLVERYISPAAVKRMNALCRQESATLYMSLLAALSILLSRYTGTEDIVVGSPIANRRDPEVEPLIGAFVNMLAMRADLSGAPSFREILRRVRDYAFNAYNNQELPFQLLIEKLSPARKGTYSPLYGVVFALQNAAAARIQSFAGLPCVQSDLVGGIASVDLILEGEESAAGLRIRATYDADQYARASVELFLDQYLVLLNEIIESPDAVIHALPVGPPPFAEEPSSVALAQPGKQSCRLLDAFISEALSNPTAVAVSADRTEWSYSELHRRVEELSSGLESLSLAAGAPIGICVRKVHLRILAALASWKLGLKPVFLDSALPSAVLARQAFAQHAVILLTEAADAGGFLREGLRRAPVDHVFSAVVVRVQRNLVKQDPLHLQAFTGYTEALATTLVWLQQHFPLQRADIFRGRYLFDPAAWEILWPLSQGARIDVSRRVSGTATVEHVGALASATQERRLTRSSLLLCSGEPPRPIDCARLCDQNSQHDPRRVAYLYQPAGSSAILAWRWCDPVEEQVGALLGKPAAAGLKLADAWGFSATSSIPASLLFRCGGAQWQDTGEQVRFGVDGLLRLVGSHANRLWRGEAHLDLREAEESVRAELKAVECALLPVSYGPGESRLICYYVSHGTTPASELLVGVALRLPSYLTPDALVHVTSLPLDSSGQLDQELLLHLPVVDDTDAQRLQAELQASHDGALEVVLEERRRERRYLDLPQAATVPTCAPHEDQPAIDISATLSFVEGEPLILTADAPSTLAEVLVRAAQVFPAHGVTCIDSDQQGTQTYPELLAEAERILGGLRALKLSPQDRVIFQLERNRDFLPAFWACMLGGFIPVPIAVAANYRERNATVNKIYSCWQALGAPVVLSSEERLASLAEIANTVEMPGIRVASVDSLRRHARDTQWHTSAASDIALLLLTSGSSGAPKLVTQTHRAILTRTAANVQRHGFTAEDISLNWLPLEHVGGLVMYHIQAVYLGAAQIQAYSQAVIERPLVWLDWMQQYRVTLTWAPNFAYGLVNAQAQQLSQGSWQLGTVRHILNAGEAIAGATARRFLSLLAPHNLRSDSMYPCWGMSETCSGVLYSDSFRAGTEYEAAPVEVGRPIPGFSVRLVDDSGHVVCEGTVGALQVRGKNVTHGYLDNPSANEAAFPEQDWFDTGDLAVMRDGNVTICGRKKEQIVIHGVNHNAAEIEATVEAVLGVSPSYTAAVAVSDASGEKLAIFFHTPADRAELRTLLSEVRRAVLQAHELSPAYLLPIEMIDIAKTELGKIRKAELRRRWDAGEFASVQAKVGQLTGRADALPAWFVEQVWRRDERAWFATPGTQGATLLFASNAAPLAAVSTALQASGRDVIEMQQADTTESIPAGGGYRWNPLHAEGALQLLEAIRSTGAVLREIVWLLQSPASELASALQPSLGSVLHLVQALERVQGSSHLVSLNVVTRGSQAILPGEHPSSFSPTTALLKTIAIELPWVSCREIDLAPAAADFSGLVRELSRVTPRIQVALRGGSRFTRGLAAVDVTQALTSSQPLATPGLWLVTGGLGGVGAALCLDVGQQSGVHLLIVGRTRLEEIQADAASSRAENYRALFAAGISFTYQAINISETAALTAAIASAEEHFHTRLAGVYHLGGVGSLAEHLQEAHRQAVLQVKLESFAQHLEAKVHGTQAIFAALADRTDLPVVCFSSVMGAFGGTGFSTYAVANAMQSDLALWYRRQGYGQACSLAWSMWDNLGMSANCPEPVRASSETMGYAVVTCDSGLASLRVALATHRGELLIGLDTTRAPISRILHEPPQPVEGLTVFHASALHDFASATTDRRGRQVTVRSIQVESIPLAADGSVDVEALKVLGQQAGGEGYAAPGTETERRIARVWGEVLGRSQVGAGDNFFDLGGHSLLATRAVARLKAELGLEIALRELFEWPTVGGLAARLDQLRTQAGPGTGEASPIRRISREGGQELSFDLSWTQSRLWFLDQFHPGSAFYNVPMGVRLRGELSVDRLRASLQALVDRHESLRTRFVSREGRPVQVIDRHAELSWRVVENESGEAATAALVEAEARVPFELARGPLLRVLLIREGATGHVLILNVHHIIADAWSVGVLWRELGQLYGGASLPEPELQYADYAAWQREWLSEEVQARELGYWKQQLAGAPAFLDLPTDYPRPAVMHFEGEQLRMELPAAVSAGLRELNQRHGVTLFMTLLAAFGVVLARYSGEQDLVVGTPIANRGRKEVEELVGFFVNTLIMRVRVGEELSFAGLLRELKTTTLEAYTHQELPFERLVDELHPERSSSHTPLAQVMFAVHEGTMGGAGLEGLETSRVELSTGTSRCDLVLSVEEGQHCLRVSLEYSTELFGRRRMERLLGHYGQVLEQVVRDASQPVWGLDMLTGGEREELAGWSGKVESWAGQGTIGELFTRVAEAQPEAIAVVSEGRQWSYGELNRHANQVANRLRELGVGAESAVGLAMERSLEMVGSLLGILKAGGAYVPLDPEYPQQRLDYLLSDTGARVVIADRRHAGRFATSRSAVLVPDAEGLGQSSATEPTPRATPANLAYILYTSGSTGQPKGVGVTQSSILNLVCGVEYVKLGPEQVLLQYAPLSFDASTFEIWGALLHGARLVVQRPGRASLEELGATIRRQAVTTLWLTTGLFHQMVEQRLDDLAHLHQLLTGGDSMDANMMARALIALPECHIFHFYGVTEATTFTTSHRATKGDLGGIIPVGRPIEHSQLYLLDDAGNLVPPGVNGEIYIGGAGVARGYIGQPAVSADRFVPDSISGIPGRRLYRSGDWGRYRADGRIDFIGRKDQQVKLRGFRIELGEVEAAILRHPSVRETTVVVRGTAERKALVAYVVLHAPLSVEDGALRASLTSLPAHAVPSSFVLLDRIPLTPNGKVDRAALPEPQQAGGEGYAAPGTETERRIARVWGEVLGRSQVGAGDNFFDLGGHSLLATRAVARLKAELGLEIALRELFEWPTVGGLAARLDQLRTQAGPGTGEASPIRRISREGGQELSFDLSWTQSRLWFLDQFHPGSAFYNVPMGVRLRGELSVDRLRASLQALVDRHESLRTRFVSREGRPVQVIDRHAELSWRVVENESGEAATAALVEAEARVPFELARGPLLRVLLIREGATGHVLILNVHHIIADAWSVGVLWRELGQLYGGALLPEPELQYADYAAWQREWLSEEVQARELGYWKQQLAGAPAFLDLPTDYPRPAVMHFEGEQLRMELPAAVSAGLRELNQRHGVTLFMTLLAAFGVVLARYSGEQDLVVGTPIANRGRKEVEELVGFFVNTLIMRVRVGEELSFAGLLRELKTTTLEAYTHQELPFERLVDELHPERSSSHTPLAQVMFAVHEGTMGGAGLEGLETSRVELSTGTSRCDLVLSVEEGQHCLRVSLEYSTELFGRRRMERLLGHYGQVLEQVVRDASQPVWGLDMLTGGEREELAGWSGKVESWAGQGTIGELFTRVAEAQPEAIAVVSEGRQWSYGELNRHANQVANRLRELGVGAESAVGLAMERSLEMVGSLLGILKAGGAYVPLDPEYPQQRLDYLLSDTGARVVIADRRHAGRFATSRSAVLVPDAEGLGQGSATEPTPRATPANLAYILYTSGSTGQPKGVMNTHGAVCNRLQWMVETHAMTPADKVLQKTPITFDVSAWELFGTLLCGAQLVMCRPDGHRDSQYLVRLIREQQITITHFVSPMLHQFLQEPEAVRCTSLRLVVQSGEALAPELNQRFHQVLKAVLANLYGPTEAAIDVTAWICHEGAAQIPIGHPIRNLTVQILDERLQRVPVGIPGELFIGGVGVARGYVNNPALSAESFLPDANITLAGARMYRTGDQACYREDGSVLFLGRMDNQIKLRGQRIELGEIESVLAEHRDVDQAVVKLDQDHIAGPRLVAYVTPRQKTLTVSQTFHLDTNSDHLESSEQVTRAEVNHSVSTKELRQYLAARLPASMIPSTYVLLPTLPFTTSGKVDRKALPSLRETAAAALREDKLAPRTEIEISLAEIWQRVLNLNVELSNMDIRDSFFTIGGHSLLVPPVQSEIARIFSRRIDIIDFFRYHSIEKLAALLASETSLPDAGTSAAESARDRGRRRANARRAGRTVI